jgi:hypothetical protein
MTINGESLIAVKPGPVAPNGDEVSERKLVVIKIGLEHFLHPPSRSGFCLDG